MANKILKDRRLWIVTMVVFVLLLVFFDRNNVIDRIKLRNQIRDLEAQRDYYLERIREDSIILERLKDDNFLEKYSREHYLMKREGEEVFVITNSKNSPR